MGELSEKKHALSNRIENNTSTEDRRRLLEATGKTKYNATLLPIRTVGVQGDHRSYSYCVGISCEGSPNWSDLKFFARIIPQVCHSVNRIVFVFGDIVHFPLHDVTKTTLSPSVLAVLRQADYVANQVLSSSGCDKKVSQMPVVLLPLHLGRSPLKASPSCSRSIVLRPFITDDFMTGRFAMPGEDIPLEVVKRMVSEILTVSGISSVMYDLTSKPPGTTEWE